MLLLIKYNKYEDNCKMICSEDLTQIQIGMKIIMGKKKPPKNKNTTNISSYMEHFLLLKRIEFYREEALRVMFWLSNALHYKIYPNASDKSLEISLNSLDIVDYKITKFTQMQEYIQSLKIFLNT